ncbi:PH domain-containing protein [Xanthomonas sp. XNM01]|uniref:PH domain-containing protein n=1 Tax=Xanthomonas sp. XNM01 TaxID=2769289 RepID=UPI0017801D4E|nr:PH domain-containing protein [Xanthomonas sp. XNM01]
MTDLPPPLPAAPPSGLPDGWQTLPRRGALPYALGAVLGLVPVLAAVAFVAASALDADHAWLWPLASLLPGLALGVWIGLRRHARLGWKLDQDGFATRRGNLWRSETLVPVSRVQHLDLERGPIERHLGLATLVVHTAGTRMAAVKMPLLELQDAEALRAHLAHQVETDDAL